MLALVQALDAEYKNDGIRCNAILPSVIDTPANREAMPDADHTKWVPPEQIAKVVRFLVSEDSAATSGAAVPVSGRVEDIASLPIACGPTRVARAQRPR